MIHVFFVGDEHPVTSNLGDQGHQWYQGFDHQWHLVRSSCCCRERIPMPPWQQHRRRRTRNEVLVFWFFSTGIEAAKFQDQTDLRSITLRMIWNEIYPLAMTNSSPWYRWPIYRGWPIKNGDFPWLWQSHNQMVVLWPQRKGASRDPAIEVEPALTRKVRSMSSKHGDIYQQ